LTAEQIGFMAIPKGMGPKATPAFFWENQWLEFFFLFRILFWKFSLFFFAFCFCACIAPFFP
jgi:hypothetical protein